jgi:hypothetical protein
MISDGSYQELVCALSIDKHYVKQAIILPDCGHTSCHMCLPETCDQKAECKICKQKITRNLKNDQECIAFKHYFRANINNLIHVVERQTDNQIKQFESNIYIILYDILFLNN